MENARVGSITSLNDLEVVLARSAGITSESITAIDYEARQQIDRFEGRCRDLQRRVYELQSTLDSLNEDEDEDASGLIQQLEEAQENLDQARFMLGRVENAYQYYHSQSARMQTVATQRASVARRLLVDSADDLRRYTSTPVGDDGGMVSDIIGSLIDVAGNIIAAPVPEQQVSTAVERLSQIQELNPDVWISLDPESKLDVLRTVEQTMAEIQHRDPVPIIPIDYNKNCRGSWDGSVIRINSMFLSNDPNIIRDFDGIGGIAGTVIHEGRHAYQDRAIANPGYHHDAEQVATWKWNSGDNYMPSTLNFRIYKKQARENDARRYRDAIIQSMFPNVGGTT